MTDIDRNLIHSESVLKKPPKGDCYIWLSGLGLSLCLLMVFFIIGLIVWEGTRAFWIKDIVQITLNQDSQTHIDGSKILGGEIVLKQQKSIAEIKKSGDPNESNMEWQLYVGNKDHYGFSFFYIDAGDIKTITKPGQLIKIEREEYGNLIGYPEKIIIDDDTAIDSDSSIFEGQFSTLVNEVADRRDEIKKLEKAEIGKINRKIKSFQLQKRTTDDPDSLKGLDEKLKSLQKEYEQLAERASRLRQTQNSHKLQCRLITGKRITIPLGSIINYHYPNQMSISDKLFGFFQNISNFIVSNPREANTEGGIFPSIFGTFIMTLVMTLIVTPFGIITAIYLHEYARKGVWVRLVRIGVNNLAGVPSIVFGVFGLGFFVYFLGGSIDKLFFSESLPTPTFGTGGILWASLTLALLTVPIVIVATEEGLSAVPRGLREAGLACGASKWQCLYRIVLPASVPGILTGVILAMARGAGEVAPLMLVGVVKLAPSLPVDGIYPFFHLDQKFMHLGFHIYDLGFQSPDSEAAKPMVFATTLFLILLVVILNLTAVTVREKLRKKYSMSAI